MAVFKQESCFFFWFNNSVRMFFFVVNIEYFLLCDNLWLAINFNASLLFDGVYSIIEIR